MDQCHRSKTDLRYFSLVHIIHLFAQRRPMALLALVRSVALLRAFFARISVQKFQRKMRGMNTLPDACSWACGHLIQTCKKNALRLAHVSATIARSRGRTSKRYSRSTRLDLGMPASNAGSSAGTANLCPNRTPKELFIGSCNPPPRS